MFDERFNNWDDRSRAIDLFRLIAILFMVGAHLVYNYADPTPFSSFYDAVISITNRPVSDSIYTFFYFGLSRIAVPALSVISAWFLLINLKKYERLRIIKNKAITLLTPYIFWNLALISIIYFLYFTLGRDPHSVQEHSFVYILYERMLNLSVKPINFPTYFLADLFIVISFYTILHPVFKRFPLFTIIITFTWPLVCLIDPSIKETILGEKYFFPRPSLIFFFMLGIITFPYMDRVFFKKPIKAMSNPLYIFAAILLIIISSRVRVYLESTPEFSYSLIVFYGLIILNSISSFLILAFTIKIYFKFKPKINRRIVFRIFCTHAIGLYFIKILTTRFLGDKSSLLVYFSMYAAAIAFGFFIHLLLEIVYKKFDIKILKYL